MNKALKEQYDRMLVIAEKERKIELSKQRRKYEIQRNISGVTAPAGGCHLTPECVQWHDDILRAANPDLDRPD
jgi:ABC-type dipeptide/oligopeptide/nickel transport system ATPase component